MKIGIHDIKNHFNIFEGNTRIKFNLPTHFGPYINKKKIILFNFRDKTQLFSAWNLRNLKNLIGHVLYIITELRKMCLKNKML